MGRIAPLSVNSECLQCLQEKQNTTGDTFFRVSVAFPSIYHQGLAYGGHDFITLVVLWLIHTDRYSDIHESETYFWISGIFRSSYHRGVVQNNAVVHIYSVWILLAILCLNIFIAARCCSTVQHIEWTTSRVGTNDEQRLCKLHHANLAWCRPCDSQGGNE